LNQLKFAFADSPKGSGAAGAKDVTEAMRQLLRTADSKEDHDPAAGAGETDRPLEQTASLPNLARALVHVARNKGAAGVDGQSVSEAVDNARSLLPKLRHELMSGSYRPGDIRRVWIPKPGGGQRGLGIPNVVDRVVQQAMLQILEPVFEPTFHPSSHGFRPNRGAHTAIAEAKEHIRAGYDIVVDLDLEKFFDQVNHQRLLNRLARRVDDGRFLQLVHRMLKAKVVLPDGARVSSNEGTPQGGPLSPLLSNIVLDELDWELDRRGLRFVRYADDCNIFVRSERSGHRVMGSTRRFIERRLRLKVNEEKSSVGHPRDGHFLGFRLDRSSDGAVEVHISARTRQRLDARIRELTPRMWGQSLDACLAEVSTYVRGWMAHYRICTEEGAASSPVSSPATTWCSQGSRSPDCIQFARSLVPQSHDRYRARLPQRVVRRSCRAALGRVAASESPPGGLGRPAHAVRRRDADLKSRMCDPQVRFCERPGGASPRAYSTAIARSNYQVPGGTDAAGRSRAPGSLAGRQRAGRRPVAHSPPRDSSTAHRIVSPDESMCTTKNPPPRC
jgi:group II intron reverse transcriptase/maturase